MTEQPSIATPLTIGTVCQSKNRLFKSAMSEQLADRHANPSPELINLYAQWAKGETGIVVTGNVMVDRNALGEPRNVVLDERSDLALFKRWAQSGSANNTQLWMQLNHPGKQIPSVLCKEPVSPSAIPLGGDLAAMFNPPRALTEAEIWTIIGQFAWAAEQAKQCGFSGVQIHAAHGYLCSQFLSPLQNQRSDQWGGSFANRSRFVIEVYRAIRAAVGSDFAVAIKLNSADFQRGGFSEEESTLLVQQLQAEGIDLVEISGGNYEQPSMVGVDQKPSTVAREAYFIEFAQQLATQTEVTLAVTGGFRTLSVMNRALAEGSCAVIGIARPLAVMPDYSAQLLAGVECPLPLRKVTTGIAKLDTAVMLDITWYEHQLERIGLGKRPRPNMSAWRSVLKTFWALGGVAMSRRRA